MLSHSELRWSDRDQGWEVLIPSVAFKNSTSSFFGSKPFRLVLPDLAGLYDAIDAYIDRHRARLIGDAADPGTFFVKSVKRTSADAAYNQNTFYEAWRLTIQRYGIYNPYTGRGAIKGLLPQGDEYDIVTDRHMHIKLEIEHLDTILPLLVHRKWRLGIVPEGQPELITGDHPVSLISTIRRPEGLAGALGYGLKNTAVVFPLDRRHSLWGTFEGEDEVVQNTRNQTAILNTHTMHNADRQIYSFDDKFQYFFKGAFRPGPELLPDIARYQAERHGN